MRAHWLSLALMILGASLSCNTALLAQGKNQPAAAPKVKNDSTPLDRSQTGLSYAPMIKQVSPAVVNVFSTRIARLRGPGGEPLPDAYQRPFLGGPRARREQSLGSGVIVTTDGYILTNHHVITGADEIKVALPNGKQEFTATLVGSDAKTDIAVLKVNATDLPFLTLGDSDSLEVGDVVFALGNPLGVGHSVTMGIISALGRQGMGMLDYEDYIQTDAAINQGNSGGALVDAKGRLVGINTMIVSQSGGSIGLGFAVPIRIARTVLEGLVTKGRVARGFLGVAIDMVTPPIARHMGMDDSTGVIVVQVTPGSAAEKAGVVAGDVITEVNGTKLRDPNHLRLLVASCPPGSDVALKVVRGEGQTQTLKARLADLDGVTDAEGTPEPEQKLNAGSIMRGVTLGNLTQQQRELLELPPDLQGALVLSVAASSPAAECGLRQGDVITLINRQPVSNSERAQKLIKDLGKNSVMLFVWRQGAGRFLAINER